MAAVIEVNAVLPVRAGGAAPFALRAQLTTLMWILAVGVPVAISLAFSYPTPRVVIPESLNLLIVVLVTLLGGLRVGVLAALTSMFALWTLNLPPGFTLRLVSGYDIAAVIATGIVGTTMALILHSLRSREQRAAEQRLEAERARHNDLQIITELQGAILPQAPTHVSGVSIGCAYRAGGNAVTPMGGDWYAFIPFDDGRIGIAIGDVVGHGVEAISVMAEYRFTLRTLAVGGDRPHVVLNQLEILSRQLRRIDAFTTCIYGILDPHAGSWSYANAGHLPPLLVRDGAPAVLELHNGPPIGATSRPASYVTDDVALKPSDTIVLYTDGVVERRREQLDVGIDRLCQRVNHLGRDFNQQATAVINDMVGNSAADDAALVFARLDVLKGDRQLATA